MELSRRILIILHSTLGLLLASWVSPSWAASHLVFRTSSWASVSQSEILRQFQKVYEIESRKLGKSFQIQITQEESLSASADYDGKTYRVSVPKDMLNHSRMNDDVLRFLLCHEVGHLFGGSPRKNVPPDWTGPVAHDSRSFMSSEGQADYYASLVCFRNLVKDTVVPKTLNVSPVLKSAHKEFEAPLRVQASCDIAWNFDKVHSKICQRASMAGIQFLQLVHNFPISFETPDPVITPYLIRDSYPSRQCRLDTLFRGALCNDKKPFVLDFIRDERNECQDSVEKMRPSCWYLSATDEF